MIMVVNTPIYSSVHDCLYIYMLMVIRDVWEAKLVGIERVMITGQVLILIKILNQDVKA